MYNIGGRTNVSMVTVLPPIKSKIEPKLGTLCPVNNTSVIVRLLNTQRFQLKPELRIDDTFLISKIDSRKLIHLGGNWNF